MGKGKGDLSPSSVLPAVWQKADWPRVKETAAKRCSRRLRADMRMFSHLVKAAQAGDSHNNPASRSAAVANEFVSCGGQYSFASGACRSGNCPSWRWPPVPPPAVSLAKRVVPKPPPPPTRQECLVHQKHCVAF